MTLIDFIHVRESEFMHFVNLIFQVLLCILLYCLFSFIRPRNFCQMSTFRRRVPLNQRIRQKQSCTKWDIFNNFHEQYTKYSSLQRNLSLAKTLLDVKSVEDNIAEQIKGLISWKTEATIGINELVKSLNEKREKLLDALKSLVCLQAKVTSKELLTNCQYLVNMHQAELNNPALDSIFQSTKSNDSVPIATVQKEKGRAEMAAGYPFY